MKTKSIPIFIMLVFGATCLWSQEPKTQCSVTYIANEGFLLETKTGKVLIDALFGGIKGNWCDQPDDSVSNLMLKGLAPFANIDVVLVTHRHSDHFKEEMVMAFLANNHESVLICPDQVNDLLKRNTGYSQVSSRIHSFKSDGVFDTTLSVNNMNIKILRFNHGSYFETDSVTGKSYDLHSNIENFAYYIEINDFKIFHTGDGSPSTNKDQYKIYGIGNEKMDIAFLDRVYLGREGQQIMNEYIHSKNIILMHIEPNRREYYYSFVKDIPEFFVFMKPMEKKIILK
ncbi:MAG: MBL fold metallo-hydrolase [Bacteroidetes bacterium]|nr:MBL fold metallo-hydrolase [Bacteroidota bacterium]